MDNQTVILIADDDLTILNTLEKYIVSCFPESRIITADDGNTAWNLINSNKPSIIISDISLRGFSGIELLKKIRSDSDLSDIYFIMLTAVYDTDNREIADEHGADDFLLKPLNLDLLKSRLKSAFRLSKLQNQVKAENKVLLKLAEQLENEIQDMIKLAVKFLQARIPASYDMLKTVADASVWIAKSYGEIESDQIRDIEIAAFLSQAGRIFLPDSMLKTPVLTNGLPTDPLMCQVPVSGKEIVSSMRRFKTVGEIILHIYENFDGSGIPNRLKSWQIPFASRIIRVVLDYEEYRKFQGKSPKDSYELIKRESQRLYDHRVVILMEHYIKSHEKEEIDIYEVAMQLAELQEGMILTRDVYTDKGLKLIPKGATLNLGVIKKIIAHSSTDPILGNVYVKNQKY
jgi:response regulator RpfG family c-di-GMP phosphodiesterase